MKIEPSTTRGTELAMRIQTPNTSAGELVGMVMLEPLEPHAGDPVARPGMGGGAGFAAEHRAGRDIVEHGAPGEQRIGLKDEAEIGGNAAWWYSRAHSPGG